MAREKDYYEVLGVGRNATADEIRRAYRRLAREYHPDVNQSADAAERFAEMQQAYDVLSDAEKRKAYDRFGHAGVGVGQGPGGFGRGGGWRVNVGGPGGSGQRFDASEFASVFEELFGGGGRGQGPFGAGPGRPGAPPRPAPRRGQDLHHALTVSFMTAALGGSEQMHMTADGRAQTITVKIPPGIDTGEKLRVKGEGHAGDGGGTAGDIILTVQVGGHPWFRREGLDLLVDVPVTVAEATFGAKVTVPLLKGSVEIKIPPGASSGQKLRVKEQGLTDARGNPGDFYAVIQIVAEKDPTPRAKELLQELAPELQNPRKSAPWSEG